MNIINFDDVIPDELRQHYENDNPLTVQHPSRCLLVGGSGVGKSNIMMNLLLGEQTKMTYHKVYVFCKHPNEDKYQFLKDYYKKIEEKVYKKTGQLVKLFFMSDNLEEIPDLKKDIDTSIQNVIIFDDVVTEKNQKKIENYFIASRKYSVTCLYLTQSFYATPKLIRLNSEYYFLFSIPSRSEISNLYKSFGLGIDEQKTFSKMLRESTNKKGSFFLIDTKAPSPSMLRYRKGFSEFWTNYGGEAGQLELKNKLE